MLVSRMINLSVAINPTQNNVTYMVYYFEILVLFDGVVVWFGWLLHRQRCFSFWQHDRWRTSWPITHSRDCQIPCRIVWQRSGFVGGWEEGVEECLSNTTVILYFYILLLLCFGNTIILYFWIIIILYQVI